MLEGMDSGGSRNSEEGGESRSRKGDGWKTDTFVLGSQQEGGTGEAMVPHPPKNS